MNRTIKLALALLSSFVIWTATSSQLTAQARSFTQAEIDNAPACTIDSAALPDQICSCKSGFALGSVWGSGPYTSDSSACTAAIHSGVITNAGGTIETIAAPGQASYNGSSRNGVTTSKWGAYEGTSFYVQRPLAKAATALEACSVLPSGVQSYTCTCAANAGQNQGVWGSGPYTADSNLCAAAQHAGIIGPIGGNITVLRTVGLPAYSGTAANGVTTQDWQAFTTSILFNRN